MSRRSILKGVAAFQRRVTGVVTKKYVDAKHNNFGMNLTVRVHEYTPDTYTEAGRIVMTNEIHLQQCNHFCLAPAQGKHGFALCCLCYDRAGYGLCQICYHGPNPRNYARHEELEN
jgi:hypothetical protein